MRYFKIWRDTIPEDQRLTWTFLISAMTCGIILWLAVMIYSALKGNWVNITGTSICMLMIAVMIATQTLYLKRVIASKTVNFLRNES